ncbi:uncharacterized protein LOC131247152 [Magnolia sinica]|uniref:uncharacterized protein LOC131247152 n=1 Tax=Magnolia sinica TaxID=86752 RepID=UPI00265A7201|nr:uncharacterized protein LOC131247152 [Magnolia sinica]
MKNTKDALKGWNKEEFGNIFSQIKDTLARVEQVVKDSLLNPSAHFLSLLDSKKQALCRLKNLQQIFWKEIQLHNGTFTADLDCIKAKVATFFKHLYTFEAVTLAGNLLSIIPNLVSPGDNDLLMALPLMEEVKSAASSLPADGAPEPDGADILRATKFLFQGGTIPRAFSASLHCLIPKSSAPKSFSDFWHISLCNCIYKIFSKVIVVRLNSILTRLISDEQMAFVQGWSITDSIALAQELFCDIDKKVRGSNLIIKVDLEKAYDRVSWSFLRAVLLSFGFSYLWISLAEKCWSGAWFLVLINDDTSGFFKSERGLR